MYRNTKYLICKIEDKNRSVLEEIGELNKIIRKKSIFRYGNILEIEEWEKIKFINNNYNIMIHKK